MSLRRYAILGILSCLAWFSMPAMASDPPPDAKMMNAVYIVSASVGGYPSLGLDIKTLAAYDCSKAMIAPARDSCAAANHDETFVRTASGRTWPSHHASGYQPTSNVRQFIGTRLTKT